MIDEIHYYNVTVKRNELREKVDELEVMERDMIEEALLAFVPRATRSEIDEMRTGIIGNAFRKAFEEIGGAAHTTEYHAEHAVRIGRYLQHFILNTVQHQTELHIRDDGSMPIACARYPHYLQAYFDLALAQKEAMKAKRSLDTYHNRFLVTLPIVASTAWRFIRELEIVINIENYRYLHVSQYGPATRDLLAMKKRAEDAYGRIDPQSERYRREWDSQLSEIGELKYFFNFAAIEEVMAKVVRPWSLFRPIPDYERMVAKDPLPQLEQMIEAMIAAGHINVLLNALGERQLALPG